MMRRDFGGEIIAAIAAVALLAFAVAFGILLSVSDSDDEASATAIISIITPENTLGIETNIDAEVTSEPATTKVTPVNLAPTLTSTASAIPVTSSEATESLNETSEFDIAATPIILKSITNTSPSINTDSITSTLIVSVNSTNVTVATEKATFTSTATATQTASMIPTETVIPTSTVTVTETASATSTETVTTTSTETATATFTKTATATQTASVTPTETETMTLTSTVTATQTASITPTETVIPTSTVTVTETASATSTETETVTTTSTETETATFTKTATASATATATETETATFTKTATATETASATPTPDLQGCSTPADWLIYVMQPEDNLASIATAVDSTVEELTSANCLEDESTVIPGSELYVPQFPIGPVQTGVPSISSDEGDVSELEPIGCTSPEIQITVPSLGQSVSGVIGIEGSAFLDDSFGYYKVEIRADNATTYNFYAQYDLPVVESLLAVIDVSLFDKGIYWVRLVVVDDTENIPRDATCAIPMVFE